MTHHATSWDADACIDQLVAARLAEPPAAPQMSGTALYLLIDPFLGIPSCPLHWKKACPTKPSMALGKGLAATDLQPSLSSGLPIDTALAPYFSRADRRQRPWLTPVCNGQSKRRFKLGTQKKPAPFRTGRWVAAKRSRRLRAGRTPNSAATPAYPAAHQARYLRLADRRVLGLATHVLGEPAMAASLPLVQHWHWPMHMRHGFH